jgi:spermidine synthase
MYLQRKIFFPVLFSLFFFSGVAGLIYESIWSHYLKLFVGHAAYAQTLVLVVYMGGMAIGSWLASQYTLRIKNLLLGYAAAEIIIGLTALIFHQVFVNYLSFSYDTMYPMLNSSFFISLYKWTTAPFLILAQTILLGATFPLIAGGIVRHNKETSGRVISVLYFINSLGGAVGVLLSGFYLIEKYAFPGTVRFAGIMDIAVGVGVIALCLVNKEPQNIRPKVAGKTPVKPIVQPIDGMVRTLFLVAGATAASSFIYEVGWIRMLSLVLGSSTHSFELMLSAFVLGLALGGFWIRNRLDKMKTPLVTLAKIQVFMGLCAIATLFFYSKLFYLMKFFIDSMSRTEPGYIMFNVYSHVICLILMVPATTLAGMTLPIITWYLYQRNSDEAMIGRVYASNTIGSILGVLLAIHVLMPLMGLKYLLIIGGSIDMLIGLYLVNRFAAQNRYLKIILAAVSIAAAAIPAVFVHLNPVLLSSGVYRDGKIDNDYEVAFYKDGKTSSVSLMKSSGCYILKNNGKTDASLDSDSSHVSPDEHTQILLAAYPLSYSHKVDNVGVIGLGSGMTASVLLESDSIKKMDVIEIEPCVLDAARLMGPKVRKVFKDKRCAIHIDDAKTFFSSAHKKYDLIVSEPSNPWVSGVASLFSVEFFELISKHLSKQGMLVQWFHLYEMSPELIASIVMSIDKCFIDFKAFVCGSDIVILASNSAIQNSPDDRALAVPAIAALLREISIEHDYDFKSNYIGGKKSLAFLTAMFDIPLNSDYNPVLDLNALKARILYSNADEYSRMNRFIIPVRKIIENDTMGSLHESIGRKIPIENPNSGHIGADYDAWQAWFCISNMGASREIYADSIISRIIALTVAQVRMTARDQSAAAKQIWPKYAVDLLKITMPYLPAAQMNDIWKYIDEEGKNLKIKQKSRDMLMVLKSITNNDFETVRALSIGLLGKGRIKDDEYNKMCVAAFIISCVKLNKFDGILDIWNNMGTMKFDFNLMMIYNYMVTEKLRKLENRATHS